MRLGKIMSEWAQTTSSMVWSRNRISLYEKLMGLYLDTTGGLDAIVEYLPSPPNVRDISLSQKF